MKTKAPWEAGHPPQRCCPAPPWRRPGGGGRGWRILRSLIVASFSGFQRQPSLPPSRQLDLHIFGVGRSFHHQKQPGDPQLLRRKRIYESTDDDTTSQDTERKPSGPFSRTVVLSNIAFISWLLKSVHLASELTTSLLKS